MSDWFQDLLSGIRSNASSGDTSNIPLNSGDADSELEGFENSIFEYDSGESTYSMSQHIGNLAAYGQIEELNNFLEENNIDIEQIYGEYSDASDVIQKLIETSNEEPIKDFDASELAEELNKAIAIWGTNEEVLTSILGNSQYTAEQIKAISDVYKQKYGTDLATAIDLDTSGKYKEILLARLNSAQKYISDTINEDIDFNRDNPHNVQYGNVVHSLDSAGNKVTSVFNEKGELIGTKTSQCDLDGNVVSNTVTKYVYDEKGVLRETAEILFDADGKELCKNVSRMDANGNEVQKYVKVSHPNGSVEEKTFEKFYNDENDPSLCTKMTEVNTLYDEQGEMIFKGTKESNSLVSALKNKYNLQFMGTDQEYIELNQCKTYDEVVAFWKSKGFDVDSENFLEEWQNEFVDRKFELKFVSDEIIDIVSNEMLAKVDLMAQDYSFWALPSSTFDLSEGIDLSKIDDFDKGLNDLEKGYWKNKIDEACKNKDIKEISDLYDEINAKLYPEGSQSSLIDEIPYMLKSQEYYESYGVEQVKQDMSIHDNYNAEEMEPSTYGEMLLEQLNESRKQYELHKTNMGAFDTAISFMNTLIDLGTSEDDVEAIFEQYEKQLKNLSNLEGQEFLSSFKALTGDDFDESSLIGIKFASEFSIKVEEMDENELLEQAKSLGINLENAYISSIEYIEGPPLPDGTCPMIKNQNYGKIDNEKLKTLVKEQYIEVAGLIEGMLSGEIPIEGDFSPSSMDISTLDKDATFTLPGASNSTPEKAIGDYADTVVEQREFAIDLARTAVAAMVAPSGIFALSSGAVSGFFVTGTAGAIVEAVGQVGNKDAIGDQNEFDEQFAKDVVSGFLSASFQSIGGDSAKQFYADKFHITNPYMQKAIERIGLKGVLAQITKDDVKYVMDYFTDIKNATTEEELAKIQDAFWSGFFEESVDAVNKGLIIGTLLFSVDFITDKATKEKILNSIHKKSSDIIRAGAADGINTPQEYIANWLLSSKPLLSTAARTVGNTVNIGAFDSEKMMKDGWKEMIKASFKR